MIENASKWGIKIWSLGKVLTWLEKNCSRESAAAAAAAAKHSRVGKASKKALTRSQSFVESSTASSTRQLLAPYIKIEATCCLYRPVVYEFGRIPALYISADSKAGLSPFYPPDSSHHRTSAQHQAAAAARKRHLAEQNQQPDQKRYRDGGVTAGASRKRRGEAENAAANEEEPQKKKKPGYCEICEKHYSELEPHLQTDVHKRLVNLNVTWAKVDLCIELANCNSDDSVVAGSSDQY